MKILDINCKYVEGTPRILQQIHIWQIVPIYCYLWQLTFFWNWFHVEHSFWCFGSVWVSSLLWGQPLVTAVIFNHLANPTWGSTVLWELLAENLKHFYPVVIFVAWNRVQLVHWLKSSSPRKSQIMSQKGRIVNCMYFDIRNVTNIEAAGRRGQKT